uniref:RRM domain-containing protein n=1 Tax=Fagus sylvatica TaxID=28930 RepID=A0A2N9HPY4_FAGSY
MGKQRKPKERDQSPKTDAVSSSSDVFKSLFGDTSAPQDAAVSIFSDTNPYRRKSQELGFAPAESLRGPDDFASEIPDLSGDLKEEEKKKRKRDEKKSRKLDSDSVAEAPVTPLETKKSKKEKAQKPNLASESNGALETDKVENPNLGSESNGEENPNLGLESKKKKKRKRDELEREYEVKKYGAEKEEEKEGEKGLKEKKKVVVGEKRKTVDNVEDMVVSKEGFDDESKLLRTVFVGNLPLKTKKKVLTKEFKQFGEIESVRIRSVPILDTKKPRKEAIIMKQINEAADCVHAYIVFKTEESAQASLSHNMAAVGGNHIRVDRACPPRKKLKGEIGSLYDIKRTVFVGNLPYDVKVTCLC